MYFSVKPSTFSMISMKMLIYFFVSDYSVSNLFSMGCPLCPAAGVMINRGVRLSFIEAIQQLTDNSRAPEVYVAPGKTCCTFLSNIPPPR